jgi:hypothetical protein
VYIALKNVNPQRLIMTEKTPGYAVGYGKPPLNSRFRKGRSGNPEGGRRRVKRWQPSSKRRLIKRLGQPRREAIVTGLVEKSAAGDLRATKLLLDLVQKSELAAGPAPGPDQDDDPRAYLLGELARIAAATDDSDAGAGPAESSGKLPP